MIEIHEGVPSLSGPEGSLPVREDDEITLKLAMLFEGQCEGLGSYPSRRKVWLYATALLPNLAPVYGPRGCGIEKPQTRPQRQLPQNR